MKWIIEVEIPDATASTYGMTENVIQPAVRFGVRTVLIAHFRQTYGITGRPDKRSREVAAALAEQVKVSLPNAPR